MATTCREHQRSVTTRCCVVCGIPVCEQCRRGPRYSALCVSHAGVHVIQGWTEVWRTASEVEAEIDRANVVSFGGLSIVRVLVPAHRHREALAVLQAEVLPDAG